MWLPRFVKRLLFGSPATAKEIAEVVSHGGLSALKTRSVLKPPLMAFVVFDGSAVAVRAYHRSDVEEEVADELAHYLTTCTKDFLEASDPEQPA